MLNIEVSNMEKVLERERIIKTDYPDCTFIIDGEEIKAHKLILSCCSPVFEKMFFGDLASNKIVITDIPLEDFEKMLEFIYTDNVTIKSILNAWSLFYVAHKYLLNNFIKVCSAYVEKNLSISSLVLSYEYAEIYNINELKDKCLSDICDYARGVFYNDVNYHMKPSTLLTILQQDALNIDNVELFKSILKWAVNECDIQCIEALPLNVWHLLKSLRILPYLWDLDVKYEKLMEFDEFIHVIINLLLSNMHKKKIKKNYSQKHWSILCKCRQMFKISNRIKLRDDDVFFVTISANRPIVLYGLVIMAEDGNSEDDANSYDGEILVQICDNKNFNILNESQYTGLMTYETPCYIPLSNLITLQTDVEYAFKIQYRNFKDVNMKRSILCYYISSKLVDEKRKTIVSFNEMNSSIVKGICFYPA